MADNIFVGKIEPPVPTGNMGIVLQAKVEPDESAERVKALEDKEQDAEHVAARTEWKSNNPDQTLKHYKNLYTKGVIDSLPWEEQLDTAKYSSESDNEGYQQNGEQNDTTLFNKLKK